MARGRPKQAGPRDKSGRLIKAEPTRIAANDVVTARHDWYGGRFGSKVAGDTHDAIGRAWACGLLDGTRIDPAMLRDMGRRYSTAHSIVYARVGMQMAKGDTSPRGTGDGTMDDPIGERYARMDTLARDAGSKQRLAMRKLCVEPSPDENPVWLERLIQCRYWKRVPELRDHMIMTQAVEALVAMVEG